MTTALPRLRWISAAVVGATLALAAQNCEFGAQSRTEGMRGEFPLPPAVGFVGTHPMKLAENVLSAAEHESQEGFFSIGKLTISVPPNGIPADILREYRGQVVRLTIERVEPRELKEIR